MHFLLFYKNEVLSLQLVKVHILFLLQVDVDPIVQTWVSEEHKNKHKHYYVSQDMCQSRTNPRKELWYRISFCYCDREGK